LETKIFVREMLTISKVFSPDVLRRLEIIICGVKIFAFVEPQERGSEIANRDNGAGPLIDTPPKDPIFTPCRYPGYQLM